MNDDDILNMADFTMMQRFAAGLMPVMNMRAADVVHDGVVDMADFTLMQRFASGQTTGDHCLGQRPAGWTPPGP